MHAIPFILSIHSALCILSNKAINGVEYFYRHLYYTCILCVIASMSWPADCVFVNQSFHPGN